MLELKNISKSYSSGKESSYNLVLDNISIIFPSNKISAILGASGSGKSTLLNIVGTIDNADSGNIYYHDLETELSSIKQAEKFRNKNIGFVFQSHNLLPEFTILENITLPAIISKSPKDIYLSDALSLMKKTGIEHLADKYPMNVSGGESQRAAICRALINKPTYILADEPTGNLDKANSEKVIELFSQLSKEYSFTMLVATHSTQLANFADETYRVVDKKIILDS